MACWFYWGGFVVLLESITIPYYSGSHYLYKQPNYGNFESLKPPDFDHTSEADTYRKANANFNVGERIWMQTPDDTRGYSYHDWVIVHELWEKNANFQSYYGHQDKYLEFSHDLFTFGFYFYDDLMKD